MQTYARLCLHRGEMLRIDGDENLELVCERGEFWLTANSGEDRHLRTGDRAACRRGRILLEGDGTLLLQATLRQSHYPALWRRGGALSRLALLSAPPPTRKHKGN